MDDMPIEIVNIIRQSDNTGIIDQEAEGYMPQDDDEVQVDNAEGASQMGAREQESPDVIPLQVSGTIDTEMLTVTANEMMTWGLANLWENSKEGGLWITINLCDLHDPIAQVFAGEWIDMDNFISMLGPNKEMQAHNIAGDPYMASKFFHFTITTILETLFGIHITRHQVLSQKGIFGHVKAYFGVVESQGQGSLHLHMLLWLMDAPTMEEMEVLLTQESFQDQVQAFIQANIWAYLPGLETVESIRNIANEVDIAYSRPPMPGTCSYDESLSNFK
ncbi:hypothetical protein EDD16DRAFT_1753560 [Pisolithus croceorrhizus]|nr:hypothetical protein EDD16DRAFT_1753560 [Pisolithus croceorrhizus]KAI6167676.1 hypothetical protein EDD17DRAFT_1836044 [Pisolithus thermaeus]